MANERLNEDAGPGHSSWTTTGGADSQYMQPSGRLGRWFSKFFATPAKKAVAQQETDTMAGDTIINPDRPLAPAKMSVSTGGSMPFLPELELNRKRRYREYDRMDEYPEVTAAFDIYADESTQKDTQNRRWQIKSEDLDVVDEVERLFSRIRLHKVYWDIVRNTVKFGDCFVETILDVKAPEEGLRRIKILNPNYILRIEDAMGYLEKFMQEIPDRNNWEAGASFEDNNRKYVNLDKNQIVHFRLHTSDAQYYPYGKSIAAGAVRIFRSLQMMEEAMIVYRISRAPERRIFYVDVGRLPAQKAERFIEQIKEKYKKEKFINGGNIDGRNNPLSPDEDYFIPVQDGKSTKIETLQGAQNLGEVDDVKYFRDKLLATLKIPKDYIAEFDKSPERKANLAQLDVKFARTIIRVQESVCVGLTTIAKRHLKLKDFPQSLINDLEVVLPDPSDIFTKRKMEIDEQKARVIQAVVGTGMLPKSIIYKEYFDMTEAEIEKVKEELEEEMADANMMGQPPMGPGGMPMPGAPAPGDPMAAGGMDPMAGPGGTPGAPEVGSPASGASKPPAKPAEKKATQEDVDLVQNYLSGKYGENKPQSRLVEGIAPRKEAE